MININGKTYRNIEEQHNYLNNYLNKCKKLLDLIYDCIAEENFDKVRRLLDIYGFDSVEELEDMIKGE